ncbi:MAG: aldose 1-epimerase [Actinomycetota bacterium]|nr:aldose 1-epimerase [Actinomycetota bacterium]
MPALSSLERNGWNVVRLSTSRVRVDVLPGKGADILSIKWLPKQVELLWTSPWGLRDKDAPSVAGSSAERFLELYPGGWQTIFPNGGDECELDGVVQPFHGEACIKPWTVTGTNVTDDQVTIEMSIQLSLSAFSLSKKILVGETTVTVIESVTNLSDGMRKAMWSHHPAFGAPLISGATRVRCGASTFVVDDERDEPNGDLVSGSTSNWPSAPKQDGSSADLSRLPDQSTPLDRFGYLTDIEQGHAEIANPEIGLSVSLHWDASLFPNAWYWLEAHATQGFPWFGKAYVFAIEPASSYPGQGIANVTSKTGTELTFGPYETKTQTIELRVADSAYR